MSCARILKAMDSRRDHQSLFWFPMVWIPPRNCTLYTAEDQCVHSVRSGAAGRRNESSSAWGYVSCRRMSEVAGARGQDLGRSADTKVFVGRAPRISMARGLQHLATQGVGAQEARCPFGAATPRWCGPCGHWPSQLRCSASGSAWWQRLRLQYRNSDAGALRGRCGERRRRTRRRRRIAAEPTVPVVGRAYFIRRSSRGMAPRETPFASCRGPSELLCRKYWTFQLDHEPLQPGHDHP